MTDWLAYAPVKRLGLATKNKYIFGISAGASFALKFVKTFPLDGVVSGE